MDRRSFLTRVAGVRGTKVVPSTSLPRPASTGLDPYVPDANTPWNTDWMRIGHLLRRTMFMPTWSDMVTLSNIGGPSQAVDLLLQIPSKQPTPPTAASDLTESEVGLTSMQISQLESQWASDAASLRGWWIDLMQNATTSIIEKMTFFWSGHFTTQFDVEGNYVLAPLLYNQNNLFRSNCLGSFQDLTFYVTLDGGMLVYLGGNQNVAAAPNENYARELMELFTTGLDQYSQTDVEQGAKILTGWKVPLYKGDLAPNGLWTAYFWPSDHDTGQKTFLGVVFPPIDQTLNTGDLVKMNEIQKMISTIFTARQSAVANFICEKIFNFFVYSNPTITDMDIVSDMATLLISSNWQIQPVISALLKSAYFFDNANIGAQIKTPADFAIGMARQFGVSVSIDALMTSLGQQIFNPPNVSGWPGYRDWISTTTFPLRSTASQAAISAMTDQITLAFIQQFPSYATDPAGLVNYICGLLLPRPLSTERSGELLNSALLNGAATYDWASELSTNQSSALASVRNLLTVITELPDFQLC